VTHLITPVKRFRALAVPAAASLLFILLGAIVIPYGGVQNDEALFAAPLYELNSKDFCFTAFHRQIPIMVMSYVGTLKTLLYVPILAIFGPSVWSVRLPMVLLGATTVFIFYHLSRRSCPRTAWLAAFLLATDPSFLLTNAFDWGPVALELFLLVTACFFLVRFSQGFVSVRDLAFGFFFLGLGLWNKAVFTWALAGLVCAGVAVFWPEIRKALRLRFAAAAAGAFLFGASPFVIFNLRHLNATFDSNARFESINVAWKLPEERKTLNGSALFGFLTTSQWDEHPKTTLSRRGDVALWVRTHLGEHRQNGLEYAFALALLAVPWWWRSRTARFSLIFSVVAWAVMALTRDAGNSVHHCVLIWPFPHLFVAATLARSRWTSVLGAGLVVANLLVVNQYVLDFEREGAGTNFTDALFPLSDALTDPANPAVEEPIYVVDWGMLNTLALFHQGRLLLRPDDGPFSTDTPSESDQETIRVMFSDPHAVFVGHVPSREVTAGVDRRLERAAAEAGLRKELIHGIADSNGRPVFEVFRLVKPR
jgi:4-amino-4-deoxy-L-arabinose transferase-like glycosyltransferase